MHYDGTTWSSLGFPNTLPLTSVRGSKLDDLFVASSQGVIYRYDGAHWSPVDSGSAYTLGAITGAGDSVFWFTSLNPQVFRLEDSRRDPEV